jgi:hypothetical protein
VAERAAVSRFLDAFAGVVRVKEGEYKALCRAHDDTNASLSITVAGDKLLIYCHAGCSAAAVVAAAGLGLRDLFLAGPPASGSDGDGLTREEYAAAKGLDILFLEGIGVSTSVIKGRSRLRIPYFDEAGAEIAVRYRLTLVGDRRFIWRSGDHPRPYGLWLLPKMREAGDITIVEGESDCHVLWACGEPALGLPGANTWQDEWCTLFDGLEVVYLVREPDRGGETLQRSLAASPLASRVRVIEMSAEAKDPSALYLQTGEGFVAAFAALKAAAVPLAELPAEERGRPYIQLSERPLRDICAPAVAALNEVNDPKVATPRLYRLGTEFAFLRCDPEAARIEPVDADMMRGLIDEECDFWRMTKYGPKVYPPPKEVAVNAMKLGDWRLAPLVGVAEAPVLRPDGSILAREGYDAATRLFHRPRPGLEVPVIPAIPSDRDVEAARETLLELFCDFPFTAQADRANMLGLTFTPFVRPAIGGRVPLGLITSAQQGTGKGLAARVPALIALGREPAHATLPASEEEMRKQLTAILAKGERYVLFDEVAHTIDSPSLGEAITAPVWTGRRLGHTQMLEIPVAATWAATGINLQVGRDFNRRVYLISMTSPLAQPWERTDFRHADLPAYVLEHRGRLIGALLVLARAWWAAGRPEADCPVLGSFEGWCRTVGGILAHASIEGFLGNLERLYREIDAEAAEWRLFLAAWHDHFGLLPVTVAELVADLPLFFREVLPEALADALDGRGSAPHRIGRVLRAKAGRPYGPENLRLERGAGDAHAKVATWLVRQG